MLDLELATAKLVRVSGESARSRDGARRLPGFTFADLFAGIGGFHAVLKHAGGRCVFVSEIDDAARATYLANWVDEDDTDVIINRDITTVTPETGDVGVPKHDVLTAGFPCQPFSKSGFQRGMEESRGTLFWNIARVLEERRPSVILLENVRNLAGPRHRHEWDVIIATLRRIGYRVSSTPSVFSPHLLPPALGGTPQVRDRVFIVGTYVGPDQAQREVGVPPTVVRAPVAGWNPREWNTEWILDDDEHIQHIQRYRLTNEQEEWINTWDDLVSAIWSSRGIRLPGFPLWFDAFQPLKTLDPDVLATVPEWKRNHLIKNAMFYDANRDVVDAWHRAHPHIQSFPASRRKLEWQAQDARSLWDTVMHFRPSGIRAKAPTYLPALVAITQTPVLGNRRRRLTPPEAARLQGLHRGFAFVNDREASSYKQIGNAVAVGAAWHVLHEHVKHDSLSDAPMVPAHIRQAIEAAGTGNPTGDALTCAAFA